ncbi:Dr family adhesin [Escherichia coli]|nr:Dr family adhesin [Escherichia coli]
MKKLAIMAAASMMVAVSTAHAQFSYSGNTGTVNTSGRLFHDQAAKPAY